MMMGSNGLKLEYCVDNVGGDGSVIVEDDLIRLSEFDCSGGGGFRIAVCCVSFLRGRTGL